MSADMQDVRRRRKLAGKPSESVSMACVARRFYVQGASKLEIADEFGISRFKVARLLQAAREAGLVRVEFDPPVPVDVPLSDELRAAYGVHRVLVLERAASKDSRPELRRRIGALAAQLLTEIVTEDDVLGLAWARTVNAMTEAVRQLPPCPIVQLCGVQARMDMRDRSVETVQRVAAVSGGDAYPIFGPLVLPDRRTAETLRRQPGIAEAFDRFSRTTKAVVSVGAWLPGESTVYDALGSREREAIAERGAKAEIAARPFDGAGRPLPAGVAHHVLAIDTEQLQRVPEVIALAHGQAKAEAIDAILRSGTVRTLITDAAAAEAVLALRGTAAGPAS